MESGRTRKPILYQDEVYAINGAAIEVHRQLGPGFLEAVYQEALELELSARNIPFKAQQHIPIFYKGQPLKKTYIADFVCFDKIVVEIKALSDLNNQHKAQILNYLKATSLKVGLLYNFGSYPILERDRFIYETAREQR
jgi:GxxExxY protein